MIVRCTLPTESNHVRYIVTNKWRSLLVADYSYSTDHLVVGTSPLVQQLKGAGGNADQVYTVNSWIY